MFHYVGSNICNLQTKVSLRDDYAMSSPLIWHGELVKRVEKKANYISKECPQFDTLFGKDTQSWSNGGVDSQLLVIVPWDESKETFESVAKWLDSIVYEI